MLLGLAAWPPLRFKRAVRARTRAQVVYCLLVVAFLDFVHDAWFYWTHRLLHWGPMYRHVHYVHHK